MEHGEAVRIMSNGPGAIVSELRRIDSAREQAVAAVGRMTDTIESLSDQLEKEKALRAGLQSALLRMYEHTVTANKDYGATEESKQALVACGQTFPEGW